jgi:hypothetical protein
LSARITILAIAGWVAIGIGIFFALWISYLISVAFVWCGVIFCRWTVEMMIRILTITALPMGIGFLMLRYDEKRHSTTRRRADSPNG